MILTILGTSYKWNPLTFEVITEEFISIILVFILHVLYFFIPHFHRRNSLVSILLLRKLKLQEINGTTQVTKRHIGNLLTQEPFILVFTLYQGVF